MAQGSTATGVDGTDKAWVPYYGQFSVPEIVKQAKRRQGRAN
jgi:hypothetical protein